MDHTGNESVAQYCTVSEVAVALRVSNMTVYRLVSAGDLPAVKVGRSIRLRRDEVDRYLRGRLIKAG